MKKIILIVIDGLGDDPIPQLKNKTPLEAAKTPNLDFFAKNGICGLVLPWIEKGKLPTSEDTHLAIFGYDPKKSNPGRGVLEVLGIGEKIKKDDVCFRGNFATVDENLVIIDRRAGRIENTLPLIESLNKIQLKKAKIIIKKAFGHRVGIILRGKNLSSKVTSNDPKKVGVKVLEVKALNKRAQKTADLLNQFLEIAHSILENHPLNKKRKLKALLPANYLLIRGAGKLKKIQNFKEKYNLKAAFIAGGTLYKGIGRFLKMKEIKVKGATGLVNTNLRGKFLAAKNNLKKFDFIFVHVKAADNLAEDGNFQGKKEFLERLDKEIGILRALNNVQVVVTGDHCTSSLAKAHSKSNVPILIYPAKGDKIHKFSEKECKKGTLGIIPQLKVLKKVIALAKGQNIN
jgi:2,3-bisphosphoglycerate-independent phosphoglycerate mutase